MTVDKMYCMSSFLMYRIVVDENKIFSEKYPIKMMPFPKNRERITSSEQLLEFLKYEMEKRTQGKKCGLALSGGIDSAILLKLMPKNSIAYTFKCIVPGVEVTDETVRAKEYIDYAMPEGIEHKIVPVYWEDMESLSVPLMKKKGAPIHSIEVQICKAALQAKKDGCDIFIFGETADCIYGGHSQLLSKDWTIGEFIERWSFVPAYKVLREPMMILEPYKQYEENGYVDVPSFLTYFESVASLNSYLNACGLADMELFAPYAYTIMNDKLDLQRVRRGENKYLIREIFNKLYSDFEIPDKVPMPRPTNEWLKEWTGPTRSEFWPNCTENMTGDQKWLVWILEKFLNLLEEE